jgi:hypothetical protein
LTVVPWQQILSGWSNVWDEGHPNGAASNGIHLICTTLVLLTNISLAFQTGKGTTPAYLMNLASQKCFLTLTQDLNVSLLY